MSTSNMGYKNIADNAETSEDSSSGRSSRRSRKSATAFRTISEVADILDVQQHVLRFWETKFTQVKPLKRGGGRRYYRPEDVEILKRIHHLLYTEGYTIKGVQKLLKGQGKKQVLENDNAPESDQEVMASETQERTPVSAPVEREGMNPKQKALLEAMLGDLKDLRDMIKS